MFLNTLTFSLLKLTTLISINQFNINSGKTSGIVIFLYKNLLE